VAEAQKKRNDREEDLKKAKAKLVQLSPQKEIAEAHYQDVKADVESITSFLYIARENGDTKLAGEYDKRINDLNTKLVEKQAKRDEIVNEMKVEQLKIDDIDGAYTKAVAELKKVNDRFDAQMKIAMTRQWGWGDWIRSLPILDGFADPLKIQQFTINDIPIDYNFKQVTRFDRCMSCHVGIDRGQFSRASLEKLTVKGAHDKEMETAVQIYDERKKALQGTSEADKIPDPHRLNIEPISDQVLTKERITEFCAHPRLDLYVGATGKHPAEKFGCTSCHAGQGSGTSFLDASHTPNTAPERAAWTSTRGWEPSHMWDFPMHPKRFVESSCLKCHHEVTDLISTDNRIEAPKLIKGYMLIRENGCFGCHEINGWKGGQRVGPDLRLEPSPPLDDLNKIERPRVQNDPDNRPGDLRKVGPALSRISEKTDTGWIEKWLLSPSAFRPDTKMPHYYGLSNNSKDVLPDEQKTFPNTEIASIAHYLTVNSKEYLRKAKELREADKKNPGAPDADETLLEQLLNKGRLAGEDIETFKEVKARIQLRKVVPLVDQAPDYKADAGNGRLLFSTKGCLSCHVHQGTEKGLPATDNVKALPPLKSEALFGPNLTQLKGKLKENQAAARTWLIQWILDPQAHSPRSRMPVMHLTPHEAADVAAWLLDQPSRDHGPDWGTDKMNVAPPEKKALVALASVYLTRMLSKSDMDRFFKGWSKDDLKDSAKAQFKDDTLRIIWNDIADDERTLLKMDVTDDSSLKYYLGRKAVNRLGCFGCHDIPGFENTKPIGTGLNDWGKKMADRLAFEDIGNFFKQHYYTIPTLTLTDKDGKPNTIKDIDGVKKEPYEEFYAQALLGHGADRVGYLNQKIRDPRSYDFNRIRPWDDRSRMPKFNFARPRKSAEEQAGGDDTAALFQARIFKEEAEAREAVSTFVLGLVAEQVPAKSINQPGPDRLAEVQGRQILDKYNCNGCHLIRPGVYDFKIDPKIIEGFERVAKNQDIKGEYIFLNHHDWVGRNPLGKDSLTAYGTQPRLMAKDNDEDKEYSRMTLRLSEALRFTGSDGKTENIVSSNLVSIPLDKMMPTPPPITSQADFDRVFAPGQPYGGAFANLLTPWMHLRDKDIYKNMDDPLARAALPPSLIGQGERTQPEWLFRFLKDPQPIRPMAILRMPKFNMSDQEARILVQYFAANTRQNNPGVGLPPAYEIDPQRANLDSAYWKGRTAEYVAYLKQNKVKDDKGNLLKDKEGKEKTLYEERLAAFAPIWEKVRAEREPALDKEIKALKEQADARTKEIEEKKKALGQEQDPAKKAALGTAVEEMGGMIKGTQKEIARLEGERGKLKDSVQKQSWLETQAYAADAFRLLNSRETCLKCHQIDNYRSSQEPPMAKGPPLLLAHERLRPDWIERWVNKPVRFVPYDSPMPSYFADKEMKYQQLHGGTGLEHIRAVRDVLMNYPRISNLPINRLYNPDEKK
jgi:cbb3-type cytochrome oxidase cytochrome c subunit/cytochrome c551/c552